MARPRLQHPTPAELEVLDVLWNRGPSTVREVRAALQPQRQRAYTSVMSLLNVMVEKGLARRKAKGRAFVYSARRERDAALGALAGDLVKRVFRSSASALVAHVLDQANPTEEEIRKIRETIDAYLSERKRP
jgi:predicted transcriptional regulator